MGLKSGSRNSGLDEDEKEDTEERSGLQSDGEPAEAPEQGDRASSDHEESGSSEPSEPDGTVASGIGETQKGEDTPDESDRVSVDSLPYKLRRGNVNEGREQVPYFLRPEVTEGEKQLKRTLESELGETVYKSDYREAAMVVAQRNPELIAEVLREWGYDLSK